MEIKRTTTKKDDDAEAADEQLAELLKAGEAGVGDLMRLYEEVERVYVTATPMDRFLPESGYATGTLD